MGDVGTDVMMRDADDQQPAGIFHLDPGALVAVEGCHQKILGDLEGPDQQFHLGRGGSHRPDNLGPIEAGHFHDLPGLMFDESQHDDSLIFL
jgi:hypothetical protein